MTTLAGPWKSLLAVLSVALPTTHLLLLLTLNFLSFLNIAPWCFSSYSQTPFFFQWLHFRVLPDKGGSSLGLYSCLSAVISAASIVSIIPSVKMTSKRVSLALSRLSLYLTPISPIPIFSHIVQLIIKSMLLACQPNHSNQSNFCPKPHFSCLHFCSRYHQTYNFKDMKL